MKNPEFLISKGVNLEKSLELFGDIETYNETIGEFIVSAPTKISKLKEYVATGDMSNYAIYVHSLKSDAKYFGFQKLADYAYEHEMKSKACDIYYATENLPALEKLVTDSVEIVKAYLTDEEEQKEEPIKTETTDAIEFLDKTILVVDDSNIIRNFTKRIFDGQYGVGTAKDGKEAIDIITANKGKNNIIAILLDLNMPKVDGFKVLEYLEQSDLFTEMPVSIISGDSTKETIDKAFEYPIVDMLGKPFNEQDIKRVVEKTIMYKELS